MSNFPIQLLNKIEIVEIKADVLLLLHALKYDEMYKKKDCIEDLQDLIIKIDLIEQPFKLIREDSAVD